MKEGNGEKEGAEKQVLVAEMDLNKLVEKIERNVDSHHREHLS